jgi:hypothetical protein
MKDEIISLNNKIIILQDEINKQNSILYTNINANANANINANTNANANANYDYISSDNDSLKFSEYTDNDIICDTLCKFNPITPVIPSKESSNSFDTILSDQIFDSDNSLMQECNVDLDIESEITIKNEESYIFNSEESIKKLNEIFNDIGITINENENENENKNKNNENNIYIYNIVNSENVDTDSVSDSELDIVTPPPSKNSSFCSLENGIRTRKRSLSISEVNWVDITKKFIFG